MNIEHVATLYLEDSQKKKSLTKQKRFFLNGIILSLQIGTQTSPQTSA